MTALALVAASIVAAAQDSAAPEPWDCGAKSLYHLLRLENRPAELDRLLGLLGPSTSEGRSFLTLRRAARACGLTLNAVAIPKSETRLAGPALAFIKGEKEGHFLVVRPVGHTGRLVQVLDGDLDPIVIDAEALFASRGWTGLVLTPRRANWLAILAGALGLLSTGALAARLIAQRSRRLPGRGASSPRPA